MTKFNTKKNILVFNKNLNQYPKKLTKSIIILQKSQTVVSSLHSIYVGLQKGRVSSKGLTEKESDVLRAMLVFSASGLDSVAKQLVRDTLLDVTKKDEASQKQLEKYIERKLKTKNIDGDDMLDIKNLSIILANPSPFERIVRLQEKEITSGSLQSKDELLRIASIFAITPDQICKDLDELTKAFEIRNQIIHEMDINFEGSGNSRRHRNSDQMCLYSNLLLEVGSNFIEAIKTKLA